MPSPVDSLLPARICVDCKCVYHVHDCGGRYHESKCMNMLEACPRCSSTCACGKPPGSVLCFASVSRMRMRERRRAKRHADAASRKDGAAAAGAGKSLSEPKRARVEADSAATPKYMPSAPPKGALELLPSVVSSCTTLPPSRAESPPSGEELDEQLMLMAGDDLICVDASVEGPLAHQRASAPAVKLPGQDIGSDWPHYVGLGAMEPALPQYLPEFGYGSGSAPGQVEVGGGPLAISSLLAVANQAAADAAHRAAVHAAIYQAHTGSAPHSSEAAPTGYTAAAVSAAPAIIPGVPSADALGPQLVVGGTAAAPGVPSEAETLLAPAANSSDASAALRRRAAVAMSTLLFLAAAMTAPDGDMHPVAVFSRVASGAPMRKLLVGRAAAVDALDGITTAEWSVLLVNGSAFLAAIACTARLAFPRSALASLAFSACALLLGLATNVMYHTAWASLPACDLKPAVTMKNVLHATGLQMLLAQGLDVPTDAIGRWNLHAMAHAFGTLVLATLTVSQPLIHDRLAFHQNDHPLLSPIAQHAAGSLILGPVARVGLDVYLASTKNKTLSSWVCVCNFAAIVCRLVVSATFLKLADAFTPTQAALNAFALLLGTLLAYADYIAEWADSKGFEGWAAQKFMSLSRVLMPEIYKIPLWMVAYLVIVDAPNILLDAHRMAVSSMSIQLA